MNKAIAYFGIDNFDNIIYLSRIFLWLNKKVLIVDHSESRSITYSLPQIDFIDCKADIITYRKVDFTAMSLSDNVISSYDVVLIANGFTVREDDLKYIKKIVYVTDLYIHIIERINRLETMEVEKKHLLIRNVSGIKITPEAVAMQIDKNISRENTTILNFNEGDHATGLVNQYNQTFRFTNISRQLKAYLLKEIREEYPDINAGSIQEAYKKAKKGE